LNADLGQLFQSIDSGILIALYASNTQIHGSFDDAAVRNALLALPMVTLFLSNNTGITGPFPDYLALTSPSLATLDLSYTSLSGVLWDAEPEFSNLNVMSAFVSAVVRGAKPKHALCRHVPARNPTAFVCGRRF
jgi:hypothetical protein